MFWLILWLLVDSKSSERGKTGFPVECACLQLILPGLAIGPQHREQESGEQTRLLCRGSDPAAEREELNRYLAPRWKQTNTLTVTSLELR